MTLHRIAKEMGYKSNEDFYKDYKTEADFLKFKNGGQLKKYSLGDYLDEEEAPTDYLGDTTGYQNDRLGTSSGIPTYDVNDADNDEIANDLEGTHSDKESNANRWTSKNFEKIPFFNQFQKPVAQGQTAITDETEDSQYEDAGQGLSNQMTPHKSLFALPQKLKEGKGDPAYQAQVLASQFIDPLGGTLYTSMMGEPTKGDPFNMKSKRQKQAIQKSAGSEYNQFAKEGGPIPSYNNGGPMLRDYAGGQGHEGNPEQGIPIDSNGIPTVNYNNGGNLSGEAATALVSGGGDNKEVAFTDPETKQTYIFSDEHFNQDKKVTAFAKEAGKELARIERRPNDSSTENTSLITLRKLRDEQEAIKQAKIEEAQNTLAQFQPPSQDPNTGQMVARMGGNIGELPMYHNGGQGPGHPHQESAKSIKENYMGLGEKSNWYIAADLVTQGLFSRVESAYDYLTESNVIRPERQEPATKPHNTKKWSEQNNWEKASNLILPGAGFISGNNVIRPEKKNKGGNIGELPMYDAGGVPFNKPEHPHLEDGSHPSESEELGSAGFERTDPEKRRATGAAAVQALPYLIDYAKGPVETAKRPRRETPKFGDMTLPKNLAENKIEGAYAGAKRTVRQNPGSKSEFLTRTGSLAASEAEKTGSTVAGIQIKEDEINRGLINKYKGEKYADDVAEADIYDMSKAVERNNEKENLTGITNIAAGAAKDANLYAANDRFNQQQMLALSTANPDIQFRDNGDGTFTMLRATNIHNA